MLSVLGCIDDFLGSVFGSVRSSVNCTPSTMSPRPHCAFSRETKNAPPRTPQLLLGKYFHVREKKISLYSSCFLSSLHTGSKPSTPIDSKIGQLPQRPEWCKRTKSRLDPCRFRRVMIRASLS